MNTIGSFLAYLGLLYEFEYKGNSVFQKLSIIFICLFLSLSSLVFFFISEVSYICAVLSSPMEGILISEYNCFKLGKFNFL